MGLDRAPMPFGNPPNNREAKPEPTRRASATFIEPDEGLENAHAIRCGNAGAIIIHEQSIVA